MPSQSEKRDDGHITRSRVRGKECDGPLAQVGETMGFKVACCEVAEAGVAMGQESMAGNRRKHVTLSLFQDEPPGGPVHLEASLRVTTKCQRRFEMPMDPNVDRWQNPAVRRVVKGLRSAGDEASVEQFATHLDTVQHIRQDSWNEEEVRKTT